MKLYILIACVLLITVSSCKKFLATYSQNQVFVQTATDLDELLVGDGYSDFNSLTNRFFVMDDDIQENPSLTLPEGGGTAIAYLNGYHYWQQVPDISSEGRLIDADPSSSFFLLLYSKISHLNTIIYNIPFMRAKGQPDSTLKRVNGEASFLRAYYYFILVNIYGKPYNTVSATTDYGIPLKTDPTIEDKFFTRATVKQVYDQVVSDLLGAEKELDGFNQQSVVRANQVAVQALLSRVYLYMEDYNNALVYADKVISKNYHILNLNNYNTDNNFLRLSSPETIFNSGRQGASIYSLFRSSDPFTIPIVDIYSVSDDFIKNFSEADLRIPAFFDRSETGDFLYAKTGKVNGLNDISDMFLIRLPEIYLNKAEAQAILGQNTEAISTLQELRKNRFKPEDLTSISLSGAALVNFIRDERRRELCFEMHRWLDMRRYAVNSKFPFSKTIRHISYAYNGTGRYVQGYYELKPYDQDKAAYVVPIPREEIEFNQGALTNEERPARPLMK